MRLYLIICVFLGMIPGMIAKNKGRSFIVWWAYGIILFIPALPHALLLKPDINALNRKKSKKGMRKCPFCAEWTSKDSAICLFCGKDLTSLTRAYDSGWIDADPFKEQQEIKGEPPDRHRENGL